LDLGVIDGRGLQRETRLSDRRGGRLLTVDCQL